MVYTLEPKGVCSSRMVVEVDDEGIIRNLEVFGGCNGNLKGIAALVKDRPAEDVIARIKGVQCGMRGTSCPDQLGTLLEKAMNEAKA